MRIALAMIATIALAACASSKPVQGPNGKQAFFVKCGAARIEACYEEAAKVCPQGYQFADRGQSGGAMLMPVGTGFMMARGPNTMLVECKD